MKKILYFIYLISIMTLIIALFNSNNVINAENIVLTENEKLVVDKINNSSPTDLNLYFYEVGQETGDSCIITIGDVEILIDAGPRDKYSDILINKMKSVISKDNVWDYVIASHADEDHIACFPKIFDSMFINGTYKLGTIIDFDITDNDDGIYDAITHKDEYFTTQISQKYLTKRDECLQKGTKYYSSKRAYDHGEFNLGPASLKILYNYYYDHKFKDIKVTNYDKNLISVCCLIKYKEQKLLFTGDLMQYSLPGVDEDGNVGIPLNGETLLYQYNENELNGGVTFYKAAHHGSNTSNYEGFMDKIRPQYVVVSAVAGTSINTSSYVEDGRNYTDRVPMIKPMKNMFKYTDRIYIPSLAVFNQDDPNTISGVTSYYGEILLQFDGKKVNPYTTNMCDENHVPVGINQTDWFKKNRIDSLYVYTFDEGILSYNNCTLVKYGHYDILIDCGSIDLKSRAFLPKLENYCVDKTIEYLIVTGAHMANLSQLINNKDSSHPNGVFSTFTVEHVLDFGENSPLVNKCKGEGLAGQYKALAKQHGLIKSIGGLRLITITPELSIETIESVTPDVNDEDAYSLTTIINFYNDKLLFVGDLNNYDDLIKNHSSELKDVTFYRASNACKKGNSYEFMELIRPMYTVIGTPINYNKEVEFGKLDYCNRLLSVKGGSDSHVYPTAYQGKDGNYRSINGDIEFSINYLNGAWMANPKLGSIKTGKATLLEKSAAYRLIKS